MTSYFCFRFRLYKEIPPSKEHEHKAKKHSKEKEKEKKKKKKEKKKKKDKKKKRGDSVSSAEDEDAEPTATWWENVTYTSWTPVIPVIERGSGLWVLPGYAHGQWFSTLQDTSPKKKKYLNWPVFHNARDFLNEYISLWPKYTSYV